MKTSVNLSREDYEWLKAHPEINLTGLVHKCISEAMKKYD